MRLNPLNDEVEGRRCTRRLQRREVVRGTAANHALNPDGRWNINGVSEVLAREIRFSSSTNVVATRPDSCKSAQLLAQEYTERLVAPHPEDIRSRDIGNESWVPRHRRVLDLEAALVIDCSVVSKTISAYSKKKAAGHDRCHASLWKMLNWNDDRWNSHVERELAANRQPLDPTRFQARGPRHIALRLLTLLYRLCALMGWTPRRWNIGLVKPLSKKGANMFYIEDSRPVALTVVVRRFFEKTLLPFASDSPPPAQLRHPLAFPERSSTQFAFAKGFSQLSQILMMHMLMRGATDRLISLYWLLIDFQGAYDSVPIWMVLDILWESQTAPSMVALMDALFTETYCHLQVNGVVTPLIRKFRGLFQGAVLSPLLFNVFLDPLLRALSLYIPHPCITFEREDGGNEQIQFPNHFAFADDLTLVATSPFSGQLMLDMVVNWAASRFMDIHPVKTVCLGFTENDSPTLRLAQPIRLPCVTSATVLGVKFSSAGVLAKDTFELRSEKANRTLNLTRRLRVDWNTAPRIIPVTFFRSFVRPTMEYALALILAIGSYDSPIDRRFRQLALAEIDRTNAIALRWAFQVPVSDCTRGLLSIRPLAAMAGTLLAKDRCDCLAAQFMCHLDSMAWNNPLRTLCQTLQNVHLRPCSMTRCLSNLRSNPLYAFIRHQAQALAMIHPNQPVDMGGVPVLSKLQVQSVIAKHTLVLLAFPAQLPHAAASNRIFHRRSAIATLGRGTTGRGCHRLLCLDDPPLMDDISVYLQRFFSRTHAHRFTTTPCPKGASCARQGVVPPAGNVLLGGGPANGHLAPLLSDSHVGPCGLISTLLCSTEEQDALVQLFPSFFNRLLATIVESPHARQLYSDLQVLPHLQSLIGPSLDQPFLIPDHSDLRTASAIDSLLAQRNYSRAQVLIRDIASRIYLPLGPEAPVPGLPLDLEPDYDGGLPPFDLFMQMPHAHIAGPAGPGIDPLAHGNLP